MERLRLSLDKGKVFLPEVVEEEKQIGMSEERDKDEDVERLKVELKELIDHKIEYNNGFANLLRGDYSIFLSLIALILSVYGALKLEFWPQLYVLSVYLMFGIWIFYTFIGTLRHKPKGKGICIATFTLKTSHAISCNNG